MTSDTEPLCVPLVRAATAIAILVVIDGVMRGYTEFSIAFLLGAAVMTLLAAVIELYSL